MKKFFCFLIIISFIGISSCKKKSSDPDYCGALWATALASDAMAMYNASVTYSLNPNTTTCNAYKASIQTYLDKLKKYKDCSLWTASQKADLTEAIQEAEQDLSTACN
jgi:hypothetical protein